MVSIFHLNLGFLSSSLPIRFPRTFSMCPTKCNSSWYIAQTGSRGFHFGIGRLLRAGTTSSKANSVSPNLSVRYTEEYLAMMCRSSNSVGPAYGSSSIHQSVTCRTSFSDCIRHPRFHLWT